MANDKRHPLARHTIGIIGGGVMGSACVQGLLAVGVARSRLRVAESRAVQRRRLTRQYGVTTTTDVHAVAHASTLVVLAIKPQDMDRVLDAMHTVTSIPPMISIAAGIPTTHIERRLGQDVSVIRAMPNMAMRVRESMVALARGAYATHRDLRVAMACFASVGQTVVVPESQIDAVTAVSGSGPAYYFWLTEHLARAGRSLGLSKRVADQLARQTAIGAAALLAESTETPERLRAYVTSTGGTTEAALRVFAKERMASRFRRAVRAAHQRAKRLSR